MAKFDKISVSNRRDLELIILGAALANEDRNSVLVRIADGFLTSEVAELLNSLRKDGDCKPLAKWLDERKALPEKGEKGLDSIERALARDNAREALDRIAIRITNYCKAGDLEHVIDALEQSLKTAKEII